MITENDVMNPWVVTTTKDTSVTEAIVLMLEHQISGLPVVDDDQKLIGIITEKDLLPLYNTHRQLKDIKVQDLMTTPVVSFNQDETLDDICKCLIENDFRRVPVNFFGRNHRHNLQARHHQNHPEKNDKRLTCRSKLNKSTSSSGQELLML
jgi:CBS-domain-containing membrane protein